MWHGRREEKRREQECTASDNGTGGKLVGWRRMDGRMSPTAWNPPTSLPPPITLPHDHEMQWPAVHTITHKHALKSRTKAFHIRAIVESVECFNWSLDKNISNISFPAPHVSWRPFSGQLHLLLYPVYGPKMSHVNPGRPRGGHFTVLLPNCFPLVHSNYPWGVSKHFLIANQIHFVAIWTQLPRPSKVLVNSNFFVVSV